MNLHIGEIKWFGNKKGDIDYGFISDVAGEDYHFHKLNCDWDPVPRDQGQYVLYVEAEKSKPGRRSAQSVVRVNNSLEFSLIESVVGHFKATLPPSFWAHLKFRRTSQEFDTLFLKYFDLIMRKEESTQLLSDEALTGTGKFEIRHYLQPDRAIFFCIRSAVNADIKERELLMEEVSRHLERLDALLTTNDSPRMSYFHPDFRPNEIEIVIEYANSLNDGNKGAKGALTFILDTQSIIQLKLTEQVAIGRIVRAIESKDSLLVESIPPAHVARAVEALLSESDKHWAANANPLLMQFLRLDEIPSIWARTNEGARSTAWMSFNSEQRIAVVSYFKTPERLYTNNTDEDPFEFSRRSPDIEPYIKDLTPGEIELLMKTSDRINRVTIFRLSSFAAQKVVWQYLGGWDLLYVHYAFIWAGEQSPVLENASLPQLLKNYVRLSESKNNQAVFYEFHKSLIESTITAILKEHDQYSIQRLIPKCTAGITTYCEGRPWPTYKPLTGSDRRAAFCPRMNGPCELRNEKNFGHAHIEPISNPKLSEVTAIEYLDFINADCLVDGLQNASEYTNRIAGWANRLIEITERLKCSTCGEMMRGNLKYAKNFARYMTTIASCQHGEGHDIDIYLNHCWNCNRIIDSRECKIRKHGFYLCINCGAGDPQQEFVEVGTICPFCGGSSMEPTGDYNNRIVCNSCHRSITNKKPQRKKSS